MQEVVAYAENACEHWEVLLSSCVKGSCRGYWHPCLSFVNINKQVPAVKRCTVASILAYKKNSLSMSRLAFVATLCIY